MTPSKSENLIKLHEGLRLKPYKCSAGFITIGYGYNLDAGITQEVADYLFQQSMKAVYEDCNKLPFYTQLDPVRQSVIENMIFNLGWHKFSMFKRTIDYIERGEYDIAATAMLQSKWAEQVGNRAIELSEMMRTGKWSSRV